MVSLHIVEDSQDCGQALSQYIVACNKQRFPFAQIWRAIENKLEGQPVGFVVVGHEKTAQRWAILQNGEIKQVDAEEMFTPKQAARTKKVSMAYLQAVLTDTPRYIANPALIDWDWLLTEEKKTGNTPVV